MILHPVLMPVAGGDALAGPQRVAAQRRVARCALARCAQLSGVDQRQWDQDESGAPRCSGGYYWSVSHKPLWAAAVIADRPVGIDVEKIEARNPDLFGALAGEEEWALLGDRSWHTFFSLWTAKEATLKANGVGIGQFKACRLARVDAPARFCLSYDGRDWPIEHHYHADHVAAVTASGEAVTWDIVEAG